MRKSLLRPEFAKFPVNFPVSREFGAETSSQLTASSATQSGLGGAFIPFMGFASSALGGHRGAWRGLPFARGARFRPRSTRAGARGSGRSDAEQEYFSDGMTEDL